MISAISIHALLAESDVLLAVANITAGVFLSTLSLRRATRLAAAPKATATHFYPRSPCGERRRCALAHFYPRSPCGERHPTAACRPRAVYFYPRSPCGERRCISRKQPVQAAFLSTLSLRRATNSRHNFGLQNRISIHALLAESDTCPGCSTRVQTNFYPRSPCGERLARCRCWVLSNAISIHALLAESDTPRLSRVVPTPIFLSTLSLRRATG